MRLRYIERPTPRPDQSVDLLRDEERLDRDIEFDPHRDITNKSWERLKETLEAYRQAQDWWEFSDIAKDLVLLFPERQAELHIDEGVWDGMMSELRKLRQLRTLRNPGDLEGFIFMAAAMAVLFPQRREEIGFTDEIWQELKGQLGIGRFRKTGQNYRSIVVLLLLSAPERRGELNLDGEVWNAAKRQLDKYRTEERWGKYLSTATSIVLLFPDRRDELNLDHHVLSGMKDWLEQRRRGQDWSLFSEAALDLAVLAAQDARITDDSRIEITKKKPHLAAQAKRLPQRRR